MRWMTWRAISGRHYAESYYNLPRTALNAYDVASKPITLEAGAYTRPLFSTA